MLVHMSVYSRAEDMGVIMGSFIPTLPRRERVSSSPPDGIENTASEATEHAFTPQGNLMNSTSPQFALQSDGHEMLCHCLREKPAHCQWARMCVP